MLSNEIPWPKQDFEALIIVLKQIVYKQCVIWGVYEMQEL